MTTATHRSSDRSSRRGRVAAAAAAVAITALAVPVLAELAADPSSRLQPQPMPTPPGMSPTMLSVLMNERQQPASSADALAQGVQQLGEKQYEEALASLQQAKAEELNDEQKTQLSSALAQAERAAGERKTARASFEEGEKALGNGDPLTAIWHYRNAKTSQFADAATADKANTQIAVAIASVGDLKNLYNSARRDFDANNLDEAQKKFAALDAVGFRPGGITNNTAPGDYLKQIAQRQGTSTPVAAGTDTAAGATGAGASVNAAADASSNSNADSAVDAARPAGEPTMTPAERKRQARAAYEAGRTAYARGDIIAAKANFQRSADLGYRKGFGEVGPQKMLANIAQKEQADATRAAMAARSAESTAVASAADTAPTADGSTGTTATPTPADAGTTAAAAGATGATGEMAIASAQTGGSTEPTATGTPTDTQVTSSATPPAAAAGTDLQATADAARIRAEQNAFRARTLIAQADQARAGQRHDAAVSLYDEALRLDPGNTAAQEGRAQSLRASGREVNQQDILDRVTEVNRARQEAVRFTINTSLEQARIAREQNDFPGARRALLSAQAARDSETGIFTGEEITDFDNAIRAERTATDNAEAAALANQRRIDQEEALTQAEQAARNAEIARRNTVAALIKQSRDLTQQGRYKDSLKVLDQILSIDPRNDYALGVKPLVWDRQQLGAQRETMEKINRNLVDVLNQAEEARVPIPDLLVYPQDWPDISATREETIARERGGQTDQVIEALLAKPLPELRFDGVPFTDVVEFLRDTTQANIFVNWSAVEGAGIDKNTPITTRLRNVRFSKVLDIILDSAGGGVIRLGYTIDDGVITISTQEDLAKNVTTRTYDIRDLLVQIPDFDDAPDFNLDSGQGGGDGGGGGGSLFGGGGTTTDDQDENDRETIVEQITQLLTDTIASDTWKVNGGLIGAVQELGGQLIVTQTPENQTAIGRLLEQLRETRAIQVNVEARFLTVQRNFLEEVGVDFDFQFNVDYGNNPLNGFNPGSDFSPVLVRNNSVSGTTGAPTGFTAPGQLVTGLSTNLGQEAQTSGYGLSTGVSAFLDDFRASLFLRAVQLGQNATTLTAPKITLFNGQRAYVVVSNQQSYVSNLTPVVGTAAVGYNPTIAFVNSGVVLEVQATVSADRKYVTLTVRPELSRLVALRQFTFLAANVTDINPDTGTAGQALSGILQRPEVERTRLQTTVSVPDRGTLLLGGQTIMGEVEREAGVPVLSKVPFLKRLFTSRGSAKDESVLLILIKPTIIIQREVEQSSFPLLEAQ